MISSLHRWGYFLAFIGWISLPVLGQSVPPNTKVNSGASATVLPLGELKPFWRYSAALGPFHEQGQALIDIPNYVSRGDFPYRKRPYEKEVPFADHLSLVRILGGFADKRLMQGGEPDLSVRARDLAYRDADGNIQTRLELLEPRLRPYLDNGYMDFTVVLDNVPWAFPETPKSFGLGQNMPPRDMEEWRQFISQFCRELKAILPEQAVERVRFRIGTEMNGIERFGGDQKSYHAFFAASVAAVHQVFPKAKIGFFNIAGASVGGMDRQHNVNAFEVAKSSLKEPNSYAGNIMPAVDYVSFSRYFSMGMDLTQNVKTAREVWDEFEERYPELEGVSREIHEYGVAPFGEQKGADTLVTQESGALAAASTAIMTFRLLEAGIDRLWHWAPGDLADVLRNRNGKLHHLFTGVAWFYQIMEAARGGQAYLLQPLDPLPKGTEVLGLASDLEERDVLIVAAYRQKVADHTPVTVRFSLPPGFSFNLDDYQFVFLNHKTATHRLIRDELAEANLLNDSFRKRPDRLGSIRQMANGKDGEWLVGDRLPKYREHYLQSLALKDEDQHGIRLIETEDGKRLLELTLSVPEVLVLRQK